MGRKRRKIFTALVTSSSIPLNSSAVLSYDVRVFFSMCCRRGKRDRKYIFISKVRSPFLDVFSTLENFTCSGLKVVNLEKLSSDGQ